MGRFYSDHLPPTILRRAKSLVLLRDPTQENVVPVVEELRRRLPLSAGKMMQTPPKNMAAEEHGMGPRGSALICRYTNYHRLLEVSLADLKKKGDCIMCPTGYAANMAFMTALGSIVSLFLRRQLGVTR